VWRTFTDPASPRTDPAPSHVDPPRYGADPVLRIVAPAPRITGPPLRISDPALPGADPDRRITDPAHDVVDPGRQIAGEKHPAAHRWRSCPGSRRREEADLASQTHPAPPRHLGGYGDGDSTGWKLVLQAEIRPFKTTRAIEAKAPIAREHAEVSKQPVTHRTSAGFPTTEPRISSADASTENAPKSRAFKRHRPEPWREARAKRGIFTPYMSRSETRGTRVLSTELVEAELFHEMHDPPPRSLSRLSVLSPRTKTKRATMNRRPVRKSFRTLVYFAASMASSSTSKMSVLFGPILPPAPRSP
jgi:hypothetical protein